MNATDPRWLEIIKASGWQTTALAVACITVVVMVKQQIIPTDGSFYWIAVPMIGAIVFGCLSVAAIGKSVVGAVEPSARFSHFRRRRAQLRAIRDYIPHMTPKEREIIGYLLHYNQRVFQTTPDGGYAAPLIAKGVVCPIGIAGQVFGAHQVPFEIPRPVWDVLTANRATFSYKQASDGAVPWAIHWMAR